MHKMHTPKKYSPQSGKSFDIRRRGVDFIILLFLIQSRRREANSG